MGHFRFFSNLCSSGPLRSTNVAGSTRRGTGDVEIGARYMWAKVGTRFTHLAIALDAGLPTGNSRKGLGEGLYSVAPSLLLSHELRDGRYQLFSTTGLEFVVAHRRLTDLLEAPHNSVFSNSGIAARAVHGWVVGEISINSNRWNGGDDTQISLAPSYVWRLGRRTELLFGVPVGLTSSTEHLGGIVEFTFELGGRELASEKVGQ
jgi:hypothetical protein